MNQDKLLSILKNNMQFFEKEFGVKSLGIFGSYARNSYSDDSDIDVLVTFKSPNYSYWVGLYDFLEKKLGKKIELITNGKHLKPSFLNRISKEIIYV